VRGKKKVEQIFMMTAISTGYFVDMTKAAM